ncbi:hypothetical protein EDB86DRAFT_3242436 [Lactarius hatsudake]|nr:hypothetical protein EDB86DRAFT_3242436 [Lactarius hatsudake]
MHARASRPVVYNVAEVGRRSHSEEPGRTSSPLTDWRAEDRSRQQARNTARHRSHSRTGEPRTGVVSRLETQRGIAATHKLESRGQASSAGSKRNEASQPLTNWRAEDRRRQQARNAARHCSHSRTGESRTGVVSRFETQRGIAFTHQLDSRGQASSAGSKRSEAIAATHSLESRGQASQASSAGSKRSKASQPLTDWRAEDRRRQQVQNAARHRSHSPTVEPRTGVVSRLETRRSIAATHGLESRGQVSSAGSKRSETSQPLTPWRAEDRRRQQARNAARHRSHSLPGEPRTGVVSRHETQGGIVVTHSLESRGQASSAGSKRSQASQPLTNWRAEDRRRQQARNVARHRSHSRTGEPRTGVVSRLETQRGIVVTHQLESRGQASHSLPGEPRTGVVSRLETQRDIAATHGLESQRQASSAGSKRSEASQPLTLWRAENRRHQQARNAARHRSHSLPGEPKTGVVSRLETHRGIAATHSLESRGQASSAGSKRTEASQLLTSWRAEDRRATHSLGSQRQAWSAGSKRSEASQPLTNWRDEDRRRQQAQNAARHRSHSLSGEQRTGVVSRLETQRGIAATHQLETRGQASSAGSKRSETSQPLTNWRAEDRRRQQARNAARRRSDSPTGEPRTGVVSRLETHRGIEATHELESRGQALSADSKRTEASQPLTSWRAEDRRRQQARNVAKHRSHSPTGEPRTGVVSRFKTQRGIAATHQLESRGQASSAGSKCSEASQPLTDWRAEDRRRQQARNAARHRSHSRTGEPRTGVVSRLEMQRGIAATHQLESRGQASSAGSKRTEASQPLTNWRAEDRRRQQARNAPRHRSHSRTGEPRTGVVSRLETHRGIAATHILESRGQASSAGSKRSEASQTLTLWRAKNRRRQQARNAPRHRSHSLPGEPRTGVVSRLETHRGIAATHELESRGQASSAGSKRSEASQPLTDWRDEDRRRQQARNTPRHRSHSRTGEPRTGVVSRLETQRGIAVTHELESRGQASSAGSKRSDALQPLTNWRAEDGRGQQARNAARHRSHSPTGEPRTGVVSRLETHRGIAATHQLESRGHASSAGSKRSEASQPLTNWRAEDRRRQQARHATRHRGHSPTEDPRTGVVSGVETHRGIAATHELESRGQASSAGLKCTEASRSLTNWRPEDRRRQRGRNAPRHRSHSRTGEPRTGVVSRLEMHRGIAATHELESRGQASSAGSKRTEATQPLTNWRAEDKRRQQARNAPRHRSHSLPGEPRTGVVSRLETHRGNTATHQLESRGQASSAGSKRSEASQPLTNWRAEDRRCQQARNAARHRSHSPTGEPGTGVVSRLEPQRGIAATHGLERRGQASSAGSRCSEESQPLTNWRAEDRRRVVSRLETQRGIAATHSLESRGQASSAGSKRSEASQPLTDWRAEDRRRQQARHAPKHRSHSPTGEPRTGVVSGLETHRGIAATHPLESRGQASSAGSKRSEASQPLTAWRAEDRRRQQARNAARHRSHSLSGEPRTRVVSRLETQRGIVATHQLEGRGQASSAGSKRSEVSESLTNWRAVDRRRQQARHATRHRGHSRTGDPRTGVVSRFKTQQGIAATHELESRGQASSAGLKCTEASQPLTDWRDEDRRRQQARNAARHRSHSPTGKPRTGVVSRLEMQRCIAATHQLESRGQVSSAGSKCSDASQPLTNWRAEDRRRQQARNAPRHRSHSLPRETRTGVVSRLETHRGIVATHQLESRGQASSAGSKRSEASQPLSPTGEPRTGVVSRLETHRDIAATHELERRGQASSAGSKRTEASQPLTPWRAGDRRRQQARHAPRHRSHSPTGEPRTGVVSRLETLETQRGIAVTHDLESRGQASSAGSKRSEASQSLTNWRAEDRCRQQARNAARHRSHSHSGEPRTGVVSRLETQRGIAATHGLESRGQASSVCSKRTEASQPLTNWRAEDRRRQQARNAPRHRSHSPTGETRTGVVSRLETHRGIVATHQLESRGQASSAGSKRSEASQPLTPWRAEDRRRQQARNVTMHRSHSLPGEPRTGVVSRLETHRGIAATHQLESRGQASSAGSKHVVSSSKRSEASQPLTSWRAEDRRRQQARNVARHRSHSRTGETRTDVVSSSKRSEASQPLTSWRAEDRRRQQARNAARHRIHSLPGVTRTGVVSRLDTQRCIAATHSLESRGQASSAGSKRSGTRQPLTYWREAPARSGISIQEA